MATTHRLPAIGQDNGTWGDILNDFLAQSHTAEGLLVDGAVGATQLQDESIVDSKIATTAAIGKNKFALSVQTSLTSADTAVQGTQASTLPVANSTLRGQLAILTSNGADTAYICLVGTDSVTYTWVQLAVGVVVPGMPNTLGSFYAFSLGGGGAGMQVGASFDTTDFAGFTVRRGDGSTPPPTPVSGTLIWEQAVWGAGSISNSDFGLTPGNVYSYSAFTHNSLNIYNPTPLTATITA